MGNELLKKLLLFFFFFFFLMKKKGFFFLMRKHKERSIYRKKGFEKAIRKIDFYAS